MWDGAQLKGVGKSPLLFLYLKGGKFMWDDRIPTLKETRMYFYGYKQIFKIGKIALYKRHNSFRFKLTIV